MADFVAKLCEQNYASERRSVEERGDGRVLHITYYRCTIMELLGYGSYTGLSAAFNAEIFMKRGRLSILTKLCCWKVLGGGRYFIR